MKTISIRLALPLLAVLIILLLSVPSTALASGGAWTWMSGADTPNQAGVYGTLGTPDPGNVPGARQDSISWIDAAGNLWLFGGLGHGSAGNAGHLNDLWRYGVDGQWTWMSGANTSDQAGVYGVQGTPDPANVPGARYASTSWIDDSGNLWLFSGFGLDSAGNVGYLNDLWRYGVDGQWTWMSGANTWGQQGVYGAQGTPAPSNMPGARYYSISWIDGAGKLWLFGGIGRDSVGNVGYLNDLWRYDDNGEWTWMSGANTWFQAGVYGAQGTPDPANVPGARYRSISWIDGAGNLWLFGGDGVDGIGRDGWLNDLWRYDRTGEWTWMSGANTPDQPGVYGTLGIPDPTNVPGARAGGNSWIDGAGNLWLFGGAGWDSIADWGALNDLWRYDGNGEWTWMSGANKRGQAGVYGALGTPGPANVPGARGASVSWINAVGDLWLLGGGGFDGTGSSGYLNDLWRYSVRPLNAAIEVVKTVGTDPGVCGMESNTTVPAGTEVYYCYTVTNTGDVTLNLHDLVDDQLGTLFTGFPYALMPGSSVSTVDAGLTIPAVITMPTLNTATWTAYSDGGPSAMAVATAFVDVIYFSCQNPIENFENGVPAWGWTVVNNVPGGPVWGDIASCGPNGNGGNWTGGLGDAACISASTLEPGEYDAELRTPVFSLVGYSESTISFLLNYQNWAGIDRLTFDISADGGATWAPLRIYTTDQGAFQNTPGVRITTDLADYLGQANLILRWRYNWNDPAALGWYAQIDEAEFRCIQIPPTAVTLASLETGGPVGIGWGWLLAIAASGLALAGTLAGRREGQAGLR